MASVARSSAIMFAGTLTSRMLGLIRSPLLFAIAVGLNYPVGNAFDIANRLPTLIYMIVAGGVVNAVLVPAIVRAMKRSADGGSAYINKLVTLGALVLGGITVVLTIASPLLVFISASGLSGENFRLAVTFAYLCVPQVFFYGMYTLLGQILNAKENFGPFMWAPALNNIIAIAGLLALLWLYGPVSPETAGDPWSLTQILILGGSATAGIAAQALVLLIPLRKIGIRLRPDFAFRGAGLSSAAKSGMWVLGSLLAGMVPTLLISNVAAVASEQAASLPVEEALGVPGNAGYTAAYTLYSLPTSLVVVSIVTAIFTSMARAAANNDMDEVRTTTKHALRIVSVFTFLATVLLIVLAIPAVRLISPGSAWPEVRSIGLVLTTMSLGLVGIGTFTVLQRVFYALEATKTLFFIQLPMAGVQSVLTLACLLLPAHLKVVGVGLVMSVMNTVTAIVAAIVLGRKIGGLQAGPVWRTWRKLAIISLICLGVGVGLTKVVGGFGRELTLSAALVQLLVIATVMSALYLGLMFVFQLDEVESVRRLWAKVTSKRGRAATPQTTLVKDRSPHTTGGNVVMFQPGRKLRDRYELVSPITSTFSTSEEVWRGHDTVLGHDVRIIVIPTDHDRREEILDSARRGVFVDDLRLIKLLSIFDTDEASVIVTELPQGASLDSFMASGPIGAEQARAIAGETAGALDAGVRRGVRHPGLRPDLIYIDSSSALFVDGLGIEPSATPAGGEDLSTELDKRDGRNLSLLLAAMLTGTQLPVSDENELLRTAAEDAPDELAQLLREQADGRGALSTGDFIRSIVPWGSVSVEELPSPATKQGTEAPESIVEADQNATIIAPIVGEEPRDQEGPSAEDTLIANPDPDDTKVDTEPEETQASTMRAWPGREDGADEETQAMPGAVPPPPVANRARTNEVRPARRTTTTAAAETSTRSSAPTPASVSGAGGEAAPVPESWSTSPSWADVASDDEEETGSNRSFATPFVLIVAALLVIGGGVWAFNTLTSDTDPVTLPSTSATPPAEEEPTDDGGGEAEPTEEEPTEAEEELPPPVISNVTLLNPQAANLDPTTVDTQDNPGSIPYSFDGNPGTYWSSWWYSDQAFWMKDGIGLEITLEAETDVSEVVLNVDGEGGLVQWRDTVASAPNSGQVIAEGPMSGDTSLKAGEPVRTTTVILWFEDLPAANSDGKYRIDLGEITVK